MKKLLVIGMVLALLVPASSFAHRSTSWWTTDKADTSLYDSRWAEANEVIDAWCDGTGRNRIDAAGDPAYLHFVCVFMYEAGNASNPAICQRKVILHVITEKAFRLTNFGSVSCNWIED